MNRFGRLSALWACFYSRDLYHEVAYEWKGIGVVYLLLLLGLCWLPSAARWFLYLRGFAAAEGRAIVRQLPLIKIENGVMKAIPPGRHVIRLELEKGGADEGLIIIDDTIDTVPSEAPIDAFVLTRREAGVIRPSRNERRVWTLTPAADMEVAPEDVGALLSSLALWVPPIGYLGAVTGSLAFRLLQALLYGAVAVAYARQRRANLAYDGAIRLAAVAITPVVLVRTLLWFGPWDPAWYVWWPTALLITLAYIAFGIRAIETTSDDVVPDHAD